MTSLRTILFGKTPWSLPPNLEKEVQGTAQPHHRERNRLKKPVPQEQLQYSDALWNLVVRSKSYLNVHEDHINPMNVYRYPDASETPSLQQTPPPVRAKQSSDSISLYSHFEMKPEEIRRRRAKTPVYRIGQLEEKACLDAWKEADVTTLLAQEYQDELPSRCFTPFTKAAALNPYRNSLRRMKCHESLRDMVKTIPEDDQVVNFTASEPYSPFFEERPSLDFESTRCSPIENHIDTLRSSRSRFLRGSFEMHPSRRNSSDSETLIGSDSGLSPNSPGFGYFSKSALDSAAMLDDCKSLGKKDHLPHSTKTENGVGMQLCLDLLTNGLATALYKQHPVETGNRSSGLQILLMIEAYESLQLQVRKEMLGSHVTSLSEDQCKAVEGTLDYWLQALRSIYERSLTRDRCISVF